MTDADIKAHPIKHKRSLKTGQKYTVEWDDESQEYRLPMWQSGNRASRRRHVAVERKR